MLNPFQNDRSVPFSLQQLQLIPRVSGAREDIGFPFARGEEDVVFDLFIMFLGKLSAEYRITEPGLVTYAGSEWNLSRPG